MHRHIWSIEGSGSFWEKCNLPGCRARRKAGQSSSDTCLHTPDGRHQWQPLTFTTEDGRPHPEDSMGRVYAVCMPCQSHTYIVTSWVGYHLDHSRAG